MANINLDNNVKIRTFSPPPSGFDPLTAAESELVNSGFPSRPTDPKLLERYRRFFTRVKGKFQYIVPTFRVDPTKMPDYGEVFFSNCEAALTNGTVINGGTGNNINLGQNGTTVSTGTLITPTIIECQYTG